MRNDDVRPDDLIKVMKKEPKEEGLKNIPVTPGNYRKFKGRKSGLPRGIFWGVFGLIVLFVGGSIISFYVFRGRVIGSISANIVTMRAGVTDLQNLDPASAQQEFSSLQDASATDFGGIFGHLDFLYEGGSNAIAAFGDLSNQLSALTTELQTVQVAAANFLVTGNGATLLTQLTNLQSTVTALNKDTDTLSSATSFAGSFASLGGGDWYLALKTQLEQTQSFLDAFVPWFSAPAPHYILVLLQNPSELRPGGGFLGSYAAVTLAGGNITNVAVHDIADEDLAFHGKIIPPKPLQPEITGFRPADTNWFFDFPTSASETISYFEASDLYAPSSTQIDGAIAVSPQVISDLLSLTGPIAIGNPTTTFASSTFLVQIQKMVQNGQATNSTYPKQILSDLAAALFTNLASSTPAEQQQLPGMISNWVTDKDVMAYFKDPTFEDFLDTYGTDGAAYQLPENFNGDYFALVDTNVNGGKSDLYVSSTVSLVAQINADGTMTDQVTIARTHEGNTSPYSWYRTTNQDYMQLFVPPGSTLTASTGGAAKSIVPPINYSAKGYVADPLIANIESTEQSLFQVPSVDEHQDEGKAVFSTWSTLKAGASTQLTFNYTHRLFLAPTAGVEYQFIFEKQAGTNRNYSFEIDAPLGFVFAENGLSSYTYQSSDPPGRLIVPLTLQAIQE